MNKEDKKILIDVFKKIAIFGTIFGIIIYLQFLYFKYDIIEHEKKEVERQNKKIELFNNNTPLFCKTVNESHFIKREKIDNREWLLIDNKFINKEGYFYYFHECDL